MNPQTALSVPIPVGYTEERAARFDALLAVNYRREGKTFTDSAADHGGATAYGVSLRFLKATGSLDVDHDGFADLDLNFDHVIDAQDIRAIAADPKLADAIYFKHFWIGPGVWQLPKSLDAAVFDQAVNGGCTAAIRLLQQALNSFAPPVIAQDGVLGTKQTLPRLADCLKAEKPVLAAYRQAAADRYRKIVAADPTQAKWLNGWLNRASELGRV
ncbi:MAG TPA: glycosyl hydrolase 108 family protein [Caulobacteraceae bacterium]|nr:glycosyl hydrolase 108 family protein [Caulobacteraceae bacterium]